MNPYHHFVSSFAELVESGKSLPLGGVAPHHKPKPAADAPVALIFSPYPDDACFIGGFAPHLTRETGMRITNVAVTQGSNQSRPAAPVAGIEKCLWLAGIRSGTNGAQWPGKNQFQNADE